MDIIRKSYKIKHDKSKNNREFIYFVLNEPVPVLYLEALPLEIKNKDQYGLDTYEAVHRKNQKDLIKIRNGLKNLRDEVNLFDEKIKNQRDILKYSIEKDRELFDELKVDINKLRDDLERMKKIEEIDNKIIEMKDQIDTHNFWLEYREKNIEELRDKRSEIMNQINNSELGKIVTEPYSSLRKKLRVLDEEINAYEAEKKIRETKLSNILDEINELKEKKEIESISWLDVLGFLFNPNIDDDINSYIGIDYYERDVEGKFYFIANINSPFVREMSGTYLFYDKIQINPLDVYDNDFSNFRLVAEIKIEIVNVVQELLLPTDITYKMTIPPTHNLDDKTYLYRIGIKRIGTKLSRQASLRAFKDNISIYKNSFFDFESKGPRPSIFQYFDTMDKNLAISEHFKDYEVNYGKNLNLGLMFIII
jgi:hypothetical protein